MAGNPSWRDFVAARRHREKMIKRQKGGEWTSKKDLKIKKWERESHLGTMTEKNDRDIGWVCVCIFFIV